VSASRTSSAIVTFPAHAPSGDFHADRLTGPTLAIGPAAFCDCDRTAALPDAIEQRQALRLKLGHVHDLMLHDLT
jgi:hypothetical protein